MRELSFYKLVQFLKTYICPKEIEISIRIYSHTVQKWLSKLGYKYKNIHKDVFMDEHKWADIVEDHKKFFKRLENLKLYMLEFDKDNIIKPKIYSTNCVIRKNKRQSNIIITHDEYTFFANNKFKKLELAKKIYYWNQKVENKVLWLLNFLLPIDNYI